MDDDDLPPLPPKRVVYTQMPDDYRYGNKYAYTEQQMRDYARAAIAHFVALKRWNAQQRH